jgi:hypothetical protein
MKVCAIVLIALTVAALSHAFVFIAFTTFFYWYYMLKEVSITQNNINKYIMIMTMVLSIQL